MGDPGRRSHTNVIGLRAADLVFDPTLACCKVDAPAPAARWRRRYRTQRHLYGTHRLVATGPRGSGARWAGLTSKPHHAQQPQVALRGSFRLRLASTCNHRPARSPSPSVGASAGTWFCQARWSAPVGRPRAAQVGSGRLRPVQVRPGQLRCARVGSGRVSSGRVSSGRPSSRSGQEEAAIRTGRPGAGWRFTSSYARPRGVPGFGAHAPAASPHTVSTSSRLTT